MEQKAAPPIENIYFVYDEIDSPICGTCPFCEGEAYLAEAAQAAHQVENHTEIPLDIPQGLAWCPNCHKAVKAVPEKE